MSKPKVYLTGAGPGDYKLISLRALEAIKKADVIIYDYLANPELLKFAREDCRLIYVGKKAGKHTLPQDKINQVLVREAKKHKIIVRLKGGDPFIFGRGAEEALYLKKKKIDFEIIPGISSASAVPAYAGIPLTDRSKNSSVGFITGHEDPTKDSSSINWEALSQALGTMVFLMGIGCLPKIVEKLIVAGKPKSTLVAIIRQGTTSQQKTIIGNLGNIVSLARKNKIAPPAIIVIGEVVSLRKELKWFEKKPLFGKRIIVTRTREQASKLTDALTDLGAEAIEVPVIKVVSLKKDKEIKDIKDYDWVFFTSQNGVKEFTRILEKTNQDCRILGNAKVCAIGSETTKALFEIGIKPDYQPNKFVAEAVVKHFKQPKFKNKQALILRARKARNVLPTGLKKAGWGVKTVNLYDTQLPEKRKFNLEKVDFVTFTSSSTVENFIKLLGKNYKSFFKKTKIASIGPITSQTIRKYGLKVYQEAKVYTIKGLVEVIIKK